MRAAGTISGIVSTVFCAVSLFACAGCGGDSVPSADSFVDSFVDSLGYDADLSDSPAADVSALDYTAVDSDVSESGDLESLDATSDAVSGDDADQPSEMKIFSIDPDSGDGTTGTTVTIVGAGLSGVVDVWFGRARSPSVFVLSDTLVNCVVPPAGSGSVPVSVVDSIGRRAYSPVDFLYTSELAVFHVEPASGSASGGTPVVIQGAGFHSSPDVFIGGRPAVSVTVAGDGEILAVTPPGTPGIADVRLVSESGDVSLAGAYEYLIDEVGPTMPDVSITGVTPSRGPVGGGSTVLIAGNGFFDGLGVRIGALPCTRVTFISEQIIQVETPPGSPGAADVTVFFRYASVTLKNGYFYLGADGGTSGVFEVVPPQAGWSGGSLVSIRGFGLSASDTVWFGQYAGTIVEHVSDFELLVRTPRADAAGKVFVMVLGGGGSMLNDGFRFYDPYINGGGVRGGPIWRNLNVTVYNGSTGARLPDAYVVVGGDVHTPLQGRTDDRGQITFSDVGLAGPLDVSSTSETLTAFTYAGITGQDVSIALYSSPSPENPTEGGPGEPSQPCVVSGRVTDYGKYFIKPFWLDGTAWVECFTSTSSMYTSMSSIPESNRPDSDGFFSIPARSGEFAVVCRLMVQETGMQVGYPIRMGIRRHVQCQDGVTPWVDVSLDIPTESSYRFGIQGMPAHPLGVWEPRFSGGWHLGTDGYLALPNRGLFDGGAVTFDHLPEVPWGDEVTGLAGLGFDLYVTIAARDNSGLPYSVVQETDIAPVTGGGLFHGVPSGLSITPMALSRSFTAFERMTDGSAVALDDSGRTWILDGQTLQAGSVVVNFRANGLIGDSQTDFTAVGTRGRIFEVVGGVLNVIQTPFIADFLAIDGTVSGPQAIVTQSALLRRENGIIGVESIPSGSVLKAVRRFADGTIFAVGPDGLIVTGVSGTALAAVRPVAEDLFAVEGDSPAMVWMAGENGRVISVRDGDVTVFKTPGTETLRGILVLGECNVLFYGDSGALYSFDCFGFTDISGGGARQHAISGGVVLDPDAGTVALVSSPVTPLAAFAGFPTISIPEEGGVWNGRDVAWASGVPWNATHCQGIIAGPLGSPFWQFTAAGAVDYVVFPDFLQAIGYTPISPGPMKMNLTCSRTPRFDMGNFDYRSMATGIRETYAVDLVSFY